MESIKEKTKKSKKKSVLPKVSVIIPFYNRKKYVKECLESVLKSTLKDIEVICVDDGSTDSTALQVKSIARKDKRIRFYSCPHKGAYKARWFGVNKARGEYVHFMDSDDMIEESAYKYCYQKCHENNLDYLVFNALPFTRKEPSESELKTKEQFDKHYFLDQNCCDKVMPGMELFGSLLSHKSFFVPFHMRMVRRSLVLDSDLTECKAYWHGDNFYAVVWLYNASRAMAIDKKFCLRRVHWDSITMSKNAESIHFHSMLSVILSLCRFWKFSSRCTELGTPEAEYMFRLVRNLNKRRGKMSTEEMFKEIDKAMDGYQQDQIVFIKMCFIPLMQKWSNLVKRTAAT